MTSTTVRSEALAQRIVYRVAQARGAAATAVRWLGEQLDGNTWLCVVLMLVCVVPLVAIEAHSTLLVNDEIYTVHIAQAPSIRAMLALAREIDLHPPLHYLAQRVALHTGLPRWMASRLPSLLAVLVLCLGLFRWAAARWGNLFGFVAVGIFWLSPAMECAWSNRPYMMWLAWIGLLLLARDAALREPRPRWAIPIVFFLTLGMVMTHLLGIACIGPFLAAEVLRAFRRGRVDWMLIVTLTLPALCGAGFYYQIHHFSQNAFPPQQLPSLDAVGEIYGLVVGNTASVIAGCLLAVVLLFGRDDVAKVVPAQRTALRPSAEDALLLITLLLLPLGVLVMAHAMQVQFWLRYGFASVPAWSLLAAWLLARRLPMARTLATVMAISCVGSMVARIFTEGGPQGNAGIAAGGRTPIPLASLDPSLPIVTASPMTFVEMSDRERPEIVQRVFYLTDVAAATQYAHYTLFENEDKIARLLHLHSHAEPLPMFLREHKTFYVVGSYAAPQIWLLRKLAADGENLDYLGKFQSTYESDDLYLVTESAPVK